MSDLGLELSVVVPVHNEAARLRAVIADWADELTRLGIRHEIRVYDDGSTDGSAATITSWPDRPAGLVLVSHPNRGHGPTIRRGYDEARGEWVLQVDGDGEIDAAGFATFWARRQDHDFLLGARETAHLAAARRSVSACARTATWALFGVRLADANVPFRLMRRSALHALLPAIPTAAFAPNVALAGLAGRRGLRLLELPVATRRKATGTGALTGWRLWRTALRAFIETASVAVRARSGRRGD